MTKKERENTKIRIGNLELQPSRSLLSEYDFGHLCIAQWSEDETYNWVVADILLNKGGEPYLKTVGDRMFDEKINMADFIKLAKMGFELEKNF